jgi:polar amino acid transport system substrate-binding protein
MKPKYLILAMSLLLGSTVTPGVADVLEDVKQAGELRVGTETAFPPFDYIEEGRHVGLNVDLFDEIGKELGVSVKWVNLPWMGVLPALASRRFDIVAGPATITKARLERYRFSSPVGDAQVNLIKRRGDASIKKPEDVAGRTVGGGQGSSQLEQLKAFAAELPRPPKLREYVGANEGLADLVVGRIDAWASSLPNNVAVVSARPDTFEMVMPPFGLKLYLAYVGRKDPDSASLMRAVDVALAKLRTDGRMEAIQQRWLGVTPSLPSSVEVPEL